MRRLDRSRVLWRLASRDQNRVRSPSIHVLAPKRAPANLALRSCSARPLPVEDDDLETEWSQDSRKGMVRQRPSSLTKLAKQSTVRHQGAVSDTAEAEVTAAIQSPSSLTYTGGATIPITSKLHIVTPQEDTPRGIWPVYRLMVRSMVTVRVL